MIDVAMCLEHLVPGAQRGGVVTESYIKRAFGGDAQAAYRAVRWEDARPQPTWSEIEAVWPEVEAKMTTDASRKSRDPLAEIDTLKQRLDTMQRTAR